MKIFKLIILLFGVLLQTFCNLDKPKLVDVVVPYINDSNIVQTGSMTVEFTVTNPSSDTVIYAGAASNYTDSAKAKFGITTYSGSITSQGKFVTDYFGEPLNSLVYQSDGTGRVAGMVRRKVPVGDTDDSQMRMDLRIYMGGLFCDKNNYIPTLCPDLIETNGSFNDDNNVNTPYGAILLKKVYLPWVFIDSIGNRSTIALDDVDVSTLPPPRIECHTFTVRNESCWFHWPWPLDYDDCYLECHDNNTCFETTTYCDPPIYEF